MASSETMYILCSCCGGMNRVLTRRLREAACGRCHAVLGEARRRDRENRLWRAERQLKRWKLIFLGWALCTAAILLFQRTPGSSRVRVTVERVPGRLPAEAVPSPRTDGGMRGQRAGEQPDGDRSLPANGTVLRARGVDGHGVLTIVNHAAEPAEVCLVRADAPAEARYELYVGERQSAGLSNVDPGSYEAWYCVGGDWDTATKRFRSGRRAWKSQVPLTLTESVQHTEDELGRRFKTTRSSHLSFTVPAAGEVEAGLIPVPLAAFDALH